MKISWNSRIDSTRNTLDFQGGRIRIGRSTVNELCLDSPFVAEEAAVLYRKDGLWELVAIGLNEIKVGDKELFGGDRMPIESNIEISIFPYTITLDLPRHAALSKEARRRQRDEDMSQIIAEIHLELLRRIPRDINYSHRDSIDYKKLLDLETTIEEIVKDLRVFNNEENLLLNHVGGHAVRSQIISQFSSKEQVSNDADNIFAESGNWAQFATAVPDREKEVDETARFLVNGLGIERQTDISQRMQTVEKSYWDQWERIQYDLHNEFKTYLAFRYLKKQIKDIVFGFGPLEDLLRLPTISEIMVVNQDRIFVENSGMLENSGRRFISDQVSLAIIERIVSRVGRRIDKAQPIVDARLHDGSRVNAVIPPIAVSGPCITIRKFPGRKLLIDHLVEFGSLTKTAAEFLRAAVLCRKNVLVSGGTGTGKTTLLNCLSDFIQDKDRIVTIEDTAELQLHKQHVVRMETKQANVEGAGEFSIRDLVKNSLRMRPDRIVVGECRGAEALDMLQAMNTGHDGSMTTIHANSAADVILRLEVLVQMAADLPILSIHRQVASAIDIIVQLHRMRNGRRCVVQITEMQGFDSVTNQIRLRDLYLMEDDEKEDGQLVSTGYLPSFMGELFERKLLNLESFYQ